MNTVAVNHAMLRFAAATTATFLLCEFMGWLPSFLAPVLTGVLLANLPGRPPLKLGVVLVVVMAVAALYSFVLAWLLRGTPTVLFGLVTLTMFIAFHGMHSGKPALPGLLLLICLATIPVIVLTAPAYGNILPTALVRGIAIGVLANWAAYSLWPTPKPAVATPAAAAASAPPLTTALLSTAVVLPLMLAFLLFGIIDALPVITTVVMLVTTFDVNRSRAQALGMVFGNFAGGVLGLLLHTLLLTTPSLPFLGLLLFPTLLWFGRRIVAGGPGGAVALITCNSMLIILGSAIASGPGSFTLWTTRLFQFGLAGAFAIGMMTILWQLAGQRRPPPVAARPPAPEIAQ